MARLAPALAALTAALMLVARTAHAAPGPLDVKPRRDVAITAGALALAAGLGAPGLWPDTCRVCEPGALDASAARSLTWRDPEAAALASDVLANAIVPAGAVAHSLVSAWLDGRPADAALDALAIAEAAALALDLSQLAKGSVARLRPSAWAAGATGGGNAIRSFYSGHTSFAFSVAVAAATVSTIRGRPSAPWVWAVGLALASGVAYLRVAGEAHWVSDVVVGAVVGGGVGFAVPWLLHRPRAGRAWALAPAPGGVALVF